MTEHIEDYLNISEPVGYDNSVINIEYISQDPVYGTNLNNAIPTVITINPTSDWLLPCESYLYIEGKVLNSDGTRITRLAPKIWPNVTLLNNFFPYMYQTLRYMVNDVEIEAYNYPGQCTTIKHLATKTNKFNGLDMGWCLDTYNGHVAYTDIMYTKLQPYANADFVAANVNNPTRAEVVTFTQKIFTDFNSINPTIPIDVPTQAQIEAVVANPPVAANFRNLVSLILNNFNDKLDSDPIYGPTADCTGISVAIVVAYINAQFVNPLNISLSHETTDVNKYNTGYKKRKEFLFDTALQVMEDAEAGDFSFRIPLSYLFNFCEDYRKVMFNCKHEIQLNRQTTYMPVFKDDELPTVSYKIQLDNMRWYMPKITPNLNMQALMLKQIEDGIEVDLAFMNKKIDYFSLPNLNIFTAQINYSTGIEKPRYIIAGFQVTDTANPNNNKQNFNYALFNGVNLNGANNLMVDVNYVNVKINGTPYQLMDYNNNFNQNRIARWYNEFKKFKKSYRGNFDEDDAITFYEFRNLYRLYVFDISKQAEQLMSTGVANVSLEFNFNQPTTPPPATMKTELYVVSFYDRAWKLKSDGTRQYIVK